MIIRQGGPCLRNEAVPITGAIFSLGCYILIYIYKQITLGEGVIAKANTGIKLDEVWLFYGLREGISFEEEFVQIKGEVDGMRKFRKSFAIVLLIAMVMLTLGGCGSKSANSNSAGNLIKIASVSPLSGSQAAIGEDIKLGAQMAFDEKKAELEKLGFKVEFAPQDDQADPKMGVTVAQKLIADKSFMAVVGHFNSGVAIPSSEIYNKDNLCMVSPGTTNPDVTDRKLPSVNRICARDDVQGPMGADFVKGLGAKKVFIIHDKTTYGQGIAQEFQKRAKAIGLEVAGFEGITAGESDFSGVLNKVSSVKPDVVYFGGIYPEGSLLIRQMSEKGIKAKFMGPDGMDNAEVVKIAGNAAIGTFYSSPAADIARTPEG
jgi:branched-chain amino acid transport system substrate-binding protein